MASGGELLYLSRTDVESCGAGMHSIIETVDRVFKEKGEGRTEMPPKPGIHPRPDSFLHAMPGYVERENAAGIKWIGFFPENPKRGLAPIWGLIVLNDPETGIPQCVMDGVWITAMRTAAATAVAARYLARPESAAAAILGCGLQGRTNLMALNELFPLRTALAYNRTPQKARDYAEEMSSLCGIEVRPVDTPKKAVNEADLVVTAGTLSKAPHATIQADWLKTGVFAGPVDFDTYWSREALDRMDKFCTDDLAQLDYYQGLGYFQDIPPVHADLGEIAAGLRPGRENPEERIICCNLGLAIEDAAVGALIYRSALERGLGTRLPL